MKNMWILLVLPITILFQGCHTDSGTKEVGWLDATVAIYYTMADKIEVVSEYNGVVELSLQPKEADGFWETSEYVYQTLPKYQEKFGDFNNISTIKLCQYISHGGFTFVYLNGDLRCYHESIEDITITAVSDWNADMKAGSDITDLFEIQYASVMPFIERGFAPPVINVVTCKATEVLQNPIKMLVAESIYDNRLRFRPTIPSTVSNTKVKIAFTLDSGREVSVTASYKTIGE